MSSRQMSNKDDAPNCVRRMKACIERLSSKAPCAAFAPSIYFEPGTDEDLCIRIGGENGVNYNTAYVFTVVCLGSSTHVWEMSDKQKQELVKNIELNGGEGATSDGRLTLSEMLEFVDDPDSREIVRALPGAVHGLLNKALVKEAFGKHDADRSGYLDLAEFSSFVDVLEELHFQYLLQSAFQTFRAFFGRGQAQEIRDLMKGLSTSQVFHCKPVDEHQTLQIGVDPDCNSIWEIPPGWWRDFVYYSANNHPLHGIFACDAQHQFSWLERLAVELATLVFSFLTTYQRVNVIVVTVAGTIMWDVLFLSFTCPCLRANAADSSPEVVRRNEKISKCISLCGYLSVLVGIIIVLSYGAEHIPVHAMEVITGRCLGYLLFWALMFGIYFNPFIAWGQTDPHGRFSLGDYVGLGQWRIEKQRFRNLLAHRIMKSNSRLESNISGDQPAPVALPGDCGAANGLPELPQEGTAAAQTPSLNDVRVEVGSTDQVPSAETQQSKLKIPGILPALGSRTPEGSTTLSMKSPRSLAWLEESLPQDALNRHLEVGASQAPGLCGREGDIPQKRDHGCFVHGAAISPRSPNNYMDDISPRPPPRQDIIVFAPHLHATATMAGTARVVPATYTPRETQTGSIATGMVDYTYYPRHRYPSSELAEWLEAGGGALPKLQGGSIGGDSSMSPKLGLNKIPSLYMI